ncbi:hypothetical protein H9P43_008396 [Blastocladiella emersonii ATCC 22665]|nr:hypothetical protein H9P43_008396 [Blastocladiella emersonii ATCC 22665]
MSKSEVKRTCCGCIDIRKGVIGLLVIEFIFPLAAAALLFVGGKVVSAAAKDGGLVDEKGNVIANKDETNDVKLVVYIAAAVFGLQALWTLFGLFAAIKRKVGAFKVFSYITAVFAILNIVNAVMNLSASNIAGALLTLYFTYVFIQYSKTMREELEEKAGHGSA